MTEFLRVMVLMAAAGRLRRVLAMPVMGGLVVPVSVMPGRRGVGGLLNSRAPKA